MKSEIIWISVQLNAKCFKPDMTGVVLRNGLAFSATTGSLRFFLYAVFRHADLYPGGLNYILVILPKVYVPLH